jgi:hypothetical protein
MRADYRTATEAVHSTWTASDTPRGADWRSPRPGLDADHA